MKLSDKIEQKLSRFAISNITLYLILGYVIGYILITVDREGQIVQYLTLEPHYILRGQVFRLVTWLLIPPSSSNLFFTAIMLLFYYNIGRTLEAVWGTYRLNVYLFSGFFYTVISAFVLYFVFMALGIPFVGLGQMISTYYVNMSLFLAYACTFPNMEVLLMFVFPVKVKYLGVLYGIMMIVEVLEVARISGFVALVMAVVILASLLNFIIFYLTGRGKIRLTKEQTKQRAKFRAQTRTAAMNITKHKCAICGQTEETNPELTFRFCSKCNGNYEYCEEHLFTHKHI